MKTGHPRRNFVEALKAANVGSHAEQLAREKLQYLVSMADNTVDAEMFTHALGSLIDSTPGMAAAVQKHREEQATAAAHAARMREPK